jgi:hypothetical protein
LLYNKHIGDIAFLFMGVVILSCNICISKMLKITIRIVFIQLSLLFFATTVKIFFGLDGTIVYYIWSCLVTFYILMLLLHLPWNI